MGGWTDAMLEVNYYRNRFWHDYVKTDMIMYWKQFLKVLITVKKLIVIFSCALDGNLKIECGVHDLCNR